MTSSIKTALLALCLYAATTAFAYATQPALITDKNMAVTLGPHMDFLVDEAGELDFESVRLLPNAESTQANRSSEAHWQPVNADNIIGGFTSSVYWVRFTVENKMTERQDWLLEVTYPLLDHISLYAPDDAGVYQRTVTGDKLPYSERPVDYRHFLFPMVLNADAGKTYYMRFESNSSMFIDLRLWTGNRFAQSIDSSLLVHGILYGIVFLASVYCFMNAFFLRKRMYFYIAFAILGSMGRFN